MKLRSIIRTFAPYAAAALLAGGMAHASTITGTVFTTAPYPAPLSPSQTPSGTNLGSFTVNQINFFSSGIPSSAYTVAGFLNSNGSVETGLPASTAAMSLNNKELQLMGNVSLVAGTTYTITHDDGIFLYLNGSNTCTICSGSPTVAAGSSFSVGTTGTYSFDLLYAEVNGAPAVLDFPPTVTPEPSTFVLLGSGLLGAAGAVRRRMRI